MVVELKKCAVIELVDPVSEMCLGLGCLILGERGGVRVFQLRSMIKGREGKGGEGTVKKGRGLINGMVDHSDDKKNGNRLCHKFLLVPECTISDIYFFSQLHVSSDLQCPVTDTTSKAY